MTASSLNSAMDTSLDQFSSDVEVSLPQSSRSSKQLPTPLRFSTTSSSSDSHSSKPDSQQTEMTEDATTTHENPTKDENFWFHDGSVILQVEQKLFRVHQTILANHSEIFADLFLVPQPEGVDTLEGCPIVVLHDSSQDFTDLLHAVYNPSYFDTLPATADVNTVLTFISGILRLSTKYLIRNLRTRCIALFASKFPTTFASYTQKASTPHHERYTSESIMAGIALAQETNVHSVLPYAYYCVARLSMKRLMKEKEGDISWRDKCLCMAGRERLRWAEMSLSHAFLLVFQRASTCVSSVCAHTRGPHNEWHVLEAARAPNPLRPYTRWSHLGLCKDCVEYCQSVHEAGRKDVWERLPSFFGLQKWETLKELESL